MAKTQKRKKQSGRHPKCPNCGGRLICENNCSNLCPVCKSAVLEKTDGHMVCRLCGHSELAKEKK